MIDYAKIQIETLKLLVKNPDNNHVRACLGDTSVLLTPDGLRSYRIPRVAFFLDINKIKAMPRLQTIMNLEHDKEVYPHNEVVYTSSGVRCVSFKFEDGRVAWFNEKFVQCIEKKPSELERYNFYMKDEKSMLKVFLNNYCIAVIMPVIMPVKV